MTDTERRLLVALAWMCKQYLSGRNSTLNHQFISAAENAVDLLVQYGLVAYDGPNAVWTDEGQKFLESN
jgi:hypothetical protein